MPPKTISSAKSSAKQNTLSNYFTASSSSSANTTASSTVVTASSIVRITAELSTEATVSSSTVATSSKRPFSDLEDDSAVVRPPPARTARTVKLEIIEQLESALRAVPRPHTMIGPICAGDIRMPVAHGDGRKLTWRNFFNRVRSFHPLSKILFSLLTSDFSWPIRSLPRPYRSRRISPQIAGWLRLQVMTPMATHRGSCPVMVVQMPTEYTGIHPRLRRSAILKLTLILQAFSTFSSTPRISPPTVMTAVFTSLTAVAEDVLW